MPSLASISWAQVSLPPQASECWVCKQAHCAWPFGKVQSMFIEINSQRSPCHFLPLSWSHLTTQFRSRPVLPDSSGCFLPGCTRSGLSYFPEVQFIFLSAALTSLCLSSRCTNTVFIYWSNLYPWLASHFTRKREKHLLLTVTKSY